MSTLYQSDSVTSFLSRLNNDVFIPYIQRDFVWELDDIVRLFDSVLYDYPIGLFSLVDREIDNAGPILYQFPRRFANSYRYRFDDNVDRRPQPIELDEVNANRVQLVLDGQQRITSLFIGLKGSISTRKYNKNVDNADSWVEKELYIDVLSRPNESPENETMYNLSFFNEDNVPGANWFKLQQLLDLDKREFRNIIIDEFGSNEVSDANKTYRTVNRQLTNEPVIHFKRGDEIEGPDELLEQFVRLNRGGEELSQPDLAQSLLTEYWFRFSDNDLIAREELSHFMDKLKEHCSINYRPGKRFVINNLLYCSGNTIDLDRTNFDPNTLNQMFIEWNTDTYQTAYERVIDFLNTYNLTIKDPKKFSLQVLLYYFNKINTDFDITTLNRTNRQDIETRDNLINFLIRSNIKEIGTGSNLEKIRTILDEYNGQVFPLEEIVDSVRTQTSTMNISDELIEELLNNKQYTDNDIKFPMLLLYSNNLDYIHYGTDVQIDHIYPRSKLEKAGFELETIHNICNLQYLERDENERKNSTSFDTWLESRTEEYKQTNFIPELDEYSLDNYHKFLTRRKELLMQHTV